MPLICDWGDYVALHKYGAGLSPRNIKQKTLAWSQCGVCVWGGGGTGQ